MTRTKTGLMVALVLIGVGSLWQSPTSKNEVEPKNRNLETPAVGPNVLLIVLDAVRADFVGAYSRRWSQDESFTPAMDKLASTGALFTNAISAGSWTRPSVASLFTGLRPMRHGDWLGSGKFFGQTDDKGVPLAHSLASEFNTLAELLKKAGYTTACFAPGEHGQYHRLSGFTQGFSFYETDYGRGRYVRSDETFEALVRWFKNEKPRRKPFFTHVHTLGAHEPYTPSTPYDAMYQGLFDDWKTEVPTTGENQRYLVNGETDRSRYLELYAGLLRHADDQLAILLTELEQLGILDNTLLIVTSDHGHALWDHGRPGHGKTLYEETIHVPLIVSAPNLKPIRIQEPVELVDIFPTILEYLEVEPGIRVDGQSLLPLTREDSNFTPRPHTVSFLDPSLVTLRTRNHEKIIYNGPKGTNTQYSYELYDLTEDPDELKNIISTRPRSGFDLQAKLHRETLTQIAGWHLLLDPGEATADFSGTIDTGSPLYGPIDFHCLPSSVQADSTDWIQGTCPATGSKGRPVASAGDLSNKIELEAKMNSEALHVHFRPSDAMAPVRFDLMINGQPIEPRLIHLGSSEIPPRLPLVLGPNDSSSVGLWPENYMPSLVGDSRRVYLWRIDFPSVASESLPDETLKGLRALGYVE